MTTRTPDHLFDCVLIVLTQVDLSTARFSERVATSTVEEAAS